MRMLLRKFRSTAGKFQHGIARKKLKIEGNDDGKETFHITCVTIPPRWYSSGPQDNSLAYIFSHSEKQEHMHEPRFLSCVRVYQRGQSFSLPIQSTEECCTTVGKDRAVGTATRPLGGSKRTQTFMKSIRNPAHWLLGILYGRFPNWYSSTPHSMCPILKYWFPLCTLNGGKCILGRLLVSTCWSDNVGFGGSPQIWSFGSVLMRTNGRL